MDSRWTHSSNIWKWENPTPYLGVAGCITKTWRMQVDVIGDMVREV